MKMLELREYAIILGSGLGVICLAVLIGVAIGAVAAHFF